MVEEIDEVVRLLYAACTIRGSPGSAQYPRVVEARQGLIRRDRCSDGKMADVRLAGVRSVSTERRVLAFPAS